MINHKFIFLPALLNSIGVYKVSEQICPFHEFELRYQVSVKTLTELLVVSATELSIDGSGCSMYE